ncbi:hypothetical protein [Streptomyces lateritius]|uniref:hypothetical protein n=1 Tax=Streptomyces lateritius TaxID=67313 RepID=UPI001675041A|nr:hypothetical protein [Streptomyces lateritius]GGU12016.1 hypothetical protein GCM10010272_66500 [Streptomyces lateritius]
MPEAGHVHPYSAVHVHVYADTRQAWPSESWPERRKLGNIPDGGGHRIRTVTVAAIRLWLRL